MQLAVGQWVDRAIAAGSTIPTFRDWFFAAALLGLYARLTVPIGIHTGFLQFSRPQCSRLQTFGILTASLIAPASLEELFFRVLLLPPPLEQASVATLVLWSGIGLALFILYHPLNAWMFFPRGRKVFVNPSFLAGAALLGIVCTLAYYQSGSLWVPMVLHWGIVVVWLLRLGGYEKLYA